MRGPSRGLLALVLTLGGAMGPRAVHAEEAAPAPASPAAAAPASPAAAAVADLRPEVRIQRRFVEKRRRFAAYAGFTWLSRGDFYRSPGFDLALTYYAAERLGIDLRGGVLFSSPTDELLDVVHRTGYVPDSRPSRATVLIGARYSIGYAKIQVGSRLVVHFEPQLFLYGGMHVAQGGFADTAVGPMGELGIGFLVFATPRIQARLDAALSIDGQQRSSYVVSLGSHPVLAVGVLF